ncbi:GNAT family N-acetyltransferase [Clostridium sp. AL.422]|uniref:GNAT family N-acetyltransferase n=1 Tax=Clostridium TaxID=1485 RepID=UPI00293DBB86|nr:MULTISPECIES: GNAT family N-acetyltransferase [unclassified Clostridium]MDV4151933.1 GNAT family N-acetyltransferase [Clostridium sp. AL.422]
MEYRKLNYEEINRNLFNNFKRRQEVTKCWRKEDGKWIIKDVPFIDDWNEEEYKVLIKYLKNTIETKGVVYGAFIDDKLKGFASVEYGFIDKNNISFDLSSLHVSEDMRGHGIGKSLFQMAAKWAKESGAKKLYISSHSSVETQKFYKAMGCTEALEYNASHVEREPFDCQLEYIL